MNFLEFFISLGWLVSIDCFIGFVLYVLYNYFDKKYNSSLEITILKQENEFLKQENQKLNGTSSDFWDKNDKKRGKL